MKILNIKDLFVIDTPGYVLPWSSRDKSQGSSMENYFWFFNLVSFLKIVKLIYIYFLIYLFYLLKYALGDICSI